MENFLSGRKKVSAEKLPAGAYQLSSDNSSLSKLEVVSSNAGEPKVELITEKGSVQAIIITCKCGERIELKCHY